MLTTDRFGTSWLHRKAAPLLFCLFLLPPLLAVLRSQGQQHQEGRQMAEEEIELYTEKIYTCRTEAYAPVKKIPCYDCPSQAPNPFSKTFKYPTEYEKFTNRASKNHVGIFGQEKVFCQRSPIVGPNQHTHRRPIPEFCENEILQLRMDMPENLSKQTAFMVNWGLNRRVPFYCPPAFSTHDSPYNQTHFCLSQVCRQSYAIRPGDTKYTFGTLHVVNNNTWVLNLKLRETPGHWGLTIRVISCPSVLPYNPLCNPNLLNCCGRHTNLDLRIVRTERNRFNSPATAVGSEMFNVTIVKNFAYTSLNVTDTLTGESVALREQDFGPSEVNVTLPLGIFQVSGSTNHTCGAAELTTPITLLPMNATLNPLEFVDFSRRNLSWSIHSDLPARRYEVFPEADVSRVHNTTEKALVFSIGGDEANIPAPVKQTFLHRTEYDGIDEQHEPLQSFVVNLESFLPTNISVSLTPTHTEVQWQNPASHQDQLDIYRLNIDTTLTNAVREFDDIAPNNGSIQRFSYKHTHPYQIGETLKLRLGAVYKYQDKKDKKYWWGPEATLYVSITEAPTHSPVPNSGSASTIQTTVISTATAAASQQTTHASSVTASASPTTLPMSNELGIVVGASLAGAAVLIIAATGTGVIIYFCGKRIKNNDRRLQNPVSDEPSW